MVQVVGTLGGGVGVEEAADGGAGGGLAQQRLEHSAHGGLTPRGREPGRDHAGAAAAVLTGRDLRASGQCPSACVLRRAPAAPAPGQYDIDAGAPGPRPGPPPGCLRSGTGTPPRHGARPETPRDNPDTPRRSRARCGSPGRVVATGQVLGMADGRAGERGDGQRAKAEKEGRHPPHGGIASACRPALHSGSAPSAAFRAAGIGVASNGESRHSWTTSAARRPNATTRTGCHLRRISARRRRVKRRQSSSGASRSRSERRGQELEQHPPPAEQLESVVVGQQQRGEIMLGAVPLHHVEDARDLGLGQAEDNHTQHGLRRPVLDPRHQRPLRRRRLRRLRLRTGRPARAGALRAGRIFSSRARAAARSAGEPRTAGAARAVSAPTSRLRRCNSASRSASSDVSRSRSPISCCILRVPFSRLALSCSPPWRDLGNILGRLIGPVHERRDDVAMRRWSFDPLTRFGGRACVEVGGLSIEPLPFGRGVSVRAAIVPGVCCLPPLPSRAGAAGPEGTLSMYSQMTGLQAVSRSMVGHLER